MSKHVLNARLPEVIVKSEGGPGAKFAGVVALLFLVRWLLWVASQPPITGTIVRCVVVPPVRFGSEADFGTTKAGPSAGYFTGLSKHARPFWGHENHRNFRQRRSRAIGQPISLLLHAGCCWG